MMRKLGDSNPRYGKPVRQFSKLVVSATHPNFLLCQTGHLIPNCGAKVRYYFIRPKETSVFFHFVHASFFWDCLGLPNLLLFHGLRIASFGKHECSLKGLKKRRQVTVVVLVSLSGWVEDGIFQCIFSVCFNLFGLFQSFQSASMCRTIPFWAWLMKFKMWCISSLMGICSGILMTASSRLKLPV